MLQTRPVPTGILQLFLLVAVVLPAAPATNEASGLAVTVKVGDQSDTFMLPDVALHVGAGEPVSPFVPPGKFTAVWEGHVSAELRGNFMFQAELRGTLKLEVNGQPVLEASDSGGGSKTPMSKPVGLSKGPNAIKATFTSPASGHAFLRLGWAEKGTNNSPIPTNLFTHARSLPLENAAALRMGRELFLEHRCVRCHTDGNVITGGIPELAMDAPALDGIGSRRLFEWLSRWILDPKAVRPAARMPALLHGLTAREDSEAIAAFLASLRSEGAKPVPSPFKSRQVPADATDAPAGGGEAAPIYERLRCAACHNPPDAKVTDPAKLSQKGVGTKFPKGRLAEYLLAPEAGYVWTRMPNFHLSEKEAVELEDYLLKASDKPKDVAAPTGADVLEKGRQLVRTTGCLNCHSLKLENSFQAPTLAALHTRHRKDRAKIPAGDCLGEKPFADYKLGPEARMALDRFTAAGFESLQRHVPSEFALRETRLLRCTACHGQIDLVPPLEILGGKLKPEWSGKFMAGEIPHKIRYDNHPNGEVWVEARMPAFKAQAKGLAVGMAALHGMPPVAPGEAPVDPGMAEAGRKLVGKEGGFSCVACHAVGPMLAMEVFESEGVNLALSADRLWPDYYRRWFRNPLGIDPQTKMPMYFDDEGNSPITDVLGGNGDAQIDAVWHYLRLRERIQPPKTGLE